MATEPIKPIGTPSSTSQPGGNKVGNAIENMNAKKRKITRSILNNTGIFVGVFLVFIVIVVFTTDVKLTSIYQVIELGLSFFVLLFCSYSMFVNLSDSGSRAGKESDTYIKTLTEYEDEKKSIIDAKKQGRLTEFCRYYVIDELKNARYSIISEVGIDFDVYNTDYIGKTEEELKKYKTLTQPQINAIVRANNVKPIKLTPEMIFRRGRGSNRRAPLGTKPETKKGITYGTKFVKTCITSMLTGIIVLEVVVTPTWATFAACLLKLCPVILNGFTGYKFGYENIVYDTVNYMSDQIDLMHQFKQYIEDNPTPLAIGVEPSKNEAEEANNETAVEEIPQPAESVV